MVCRPPHQDPSPYPANNSQPYKMHHGFLNSSLGCPLVFTYPPGTLHQPGRAQTLWTPWLQIAKTGMQPFFGTTLDVTKNACALRIYMGFILKLTISGHFLRFQDIFILEHMGHTLGNNSHILDGMILPHLSGLNSHGTSQKTWYQHGYDSNCTTRPRLAG